VVEVVRVSVIDRAVVEVNVEDWAIIEVVGVRVEHRTVVEVNVEAGGALLRVRLHDPEVLAYAAQHEIDGIQED
jgi:hypothetical protein